MKLRFSQQISKKFQTTSSITIRAVGAELFDADKSAKVESHFSKFLEQA
jgi:hypothetical protein